MYNSKEDNVRDMTLAQQHILYCEISNFWHFGAVAVDKFAIRSLLQGR